MSFREYVLKQLVETDEPATEDTGKGIQVFFTDLDEIVQKKIMDQLMEALNVKPDDSFSNKKIMESLGRYPLFVTSGSEISKQLKFDI